MTPLFDFAKTQNYNIKELTNSQAKQIQALLKGCGYRIKVDGIIGEETVRVFGEFKLDNYLEHPTDLGATTYAALIAESEERQRIDRPSVEVNPVVIDTKKPKSVTIAGFGKVRTDTKIAGFLTWGQATHDGTRPVNRADHVENIRRLALQLAKFQEFIGESKPFHITSWYRPEPFNSRVGGASQSQHLYGNAVDLIVAGMTGKQLAKKAEEFGWKGGLGIYTKYPRILHLDIASPRKWGF